MYGWILITVNGKFDNDYNKDNTEDTFTKALNSNSIHIQGDIKINGYGAVGTNDKSVKCGYFKLFSGNH